MINQHQPRHKKVLKVFVDDPHIQSRAAYVKLRRKLKRQDVNENFALNFNFRPRYIAKLVKEKGELFCKYCGKGPLITDPKHPNQHLRKTMLATIDHIKAQSKGGSKYDPNNINICCPPCNTEKSNMPVEKFMALKQVNLSNSTKHDKLSS
jgi:5-methylcytosine-specific restriction endonuclease McrA